VPVTVLSRCQRFDLRRIDMANLVGLFRAVAAKEGAQVDEGALALIARAADGSARDGLSILDQAISQAAGTGAAGAPQVAEQTVRDMLGLADRAKVFDLFEAVMGGNVKGALDLLADQYAAGAAPVVVLQDLLELTHWMTRLKVAPDGADDPALAETERTRGAAMAGRLSVPALTRAWQMLIKGLGETRSAPMPLQAAEMVLVRLAYAADLPTPADAIKALANTASVPRAAAAPSPPVPTGGARAMATGATALAAAPRSQPEPAMAQALAPAPALAPADAGPTALAPATFADVVALFEQRREAKLATHLKMHAHLVRFEPGLIEFNPARGAPPDLAGQVGKFLTQWTGQRWVASVVNAAGAPTLHDQALATARAEPVVQALLSVYPDAEVSIRRADDR
jgi:DNA polymerase-3 subunit gamma/tau